MITAWFLWWSGKNFGQRRDEQAFNHLGRSSGFFSNISLLRTNFCMTDVGGMVLGGIFGLPFRFAHQPTPS